MDICYSPYTDYYNIKVAVHLHPVDLLKFARLSIDFRALFMSRASKSIWRNVLSQVVRLPQCPEDLNEPQYANLMFETFCMVNLFICYCSNAYINRNFARLVGLLKGSLKLTTKHD